MVFQKPIYRRPYNDMMYQGPRILSSREVHIDIFDAVPTDQSYPYLPVTYNRVIYKPIYI